MAAAQGFSVGGRGGAGRKIARVFRQILGLDLLGRISASRARLRREKLAGVRLQEKCNCYRVISREERRLETGGSGLDEVGCKLGKGWFTRDDFEAD